MVWFDSWMSLWLEAEVVRQVEREQQVFLTAPLTRS
jgi:hypothetical protein